MKQILLRMYSERINLFSVITTAAVTAFASLILMLGFANLLDPRDLGLYQYIISITSILATFSLTGAKSAIVRAVSKKDYDFFSIVFYYSLITSIIPLLLTMVVSSYYAYQGNYVLALGITISTIALLITQIQMRWNALYIGSQEFVKSNYILKANALGPLFILLPLLFFVSHPAVLAFIYFISSAVAVSVALWLLKTREYLYELSKNTKIVLNNRIKNIKFAIHQSIIAGIKSIGTHADKVIIFQLLGAQETAVYFIATSIPSRLRSILKQFEPYLFSKHISHPSLSVRNKLNRKVLLATLLTTPIVVGYILGAPYIFPYFFPQYIDAINLTQIYAFSIFTATAIIPYSAMKAHGSNKSFYVFAIISVIIRNSAIFLGVIQASLLGAIIGALFGTLINSVLLQVISHKGIQ